MGSRSDIHSREFRWSGKFEMKVIESLVLIVFDTRYCNNVIRIYWELQVFHTIHVHFSHRHHLTYNVESVLLFYNVVATRRANWRRQNKDLVGSEVGYGSIEYVIAGCFHRCRDWLNATYSIAATRVRSECEISRSRSLHQWTLFF